MYTVTLYTAFFGTDMSQTVPSQSILLLIFCPNTLYTASQSTFFGTHMSYTLSSQTPFFFLVGGHSHVIYLIIPDTFFFFWGGHSHVIYFCDLLGGVLTCLCKSSNGCVSSTKHFLTPYHQKGPADFAQPKRASGTPICQNKVSRKLRMAMP